jgi:DNA-binding GntR family transcriptional regulator
MSAPIGTKSGEDDFDSKLDAVASGLREATSIPVQVASGLRKLILSGQLRPGDRVVEWKIAKQLGIGQPTAREALLLLENEGLVQRNPNRGCSVTSLNLKQIDQIYCVRVELEPLAAELAVDNAANWDPAILLSAMDRLSAAATSGDMEEWHRRDLEFHQTLWRLADNPFLEKALTQISVPFFAFAELVFIRTQPRDLVHQAAEHQVFVSAILSKNRELARRTTRQVLTDFWKVWRSLTAPDA